MSFSGTYYHQLDQKNRLRIPAKLKADLNDNFVIIRGTDGCLFIYTQKYFEEKFEAKSDAISFVTPEGRMATNALRIMMKDMSVPEEDNQGRFVLDAKLREFAKIQKDVVFVGFFDRIELWSKEKYDEKYESLESDDYDKALEVLGAYGF